MKQRFLVVYDYGMGGIWGYVLASSADEIARRYPEVEVVEQEPRWISDADRAEFKRRVEDIDEPKPLSVLGAVLEARNPPPRPTNTDLLLAWHRNVRGVEWFEDEGVEIRLMGAGRVRTKINVVGTDLEHASFDPVVIDRGEDDWIRASVAEGVWTAECGPLSEEEAHGIFLGWATRSAQGAG
jgi:hypothetical protein